MKVVGAGKETWPLKEILSRWYRWIRRGNWDSRASLEAPAAHLRFGGHREGYSQDFHVQDVPGI